MQPCQVCGEVTVDAAGYCVRCRNYRGPIAAGDASLAPPPVRQRNPYLIPLIASCAAVLIVAAGIVIVAVVKSHRAPGLAGPGAASSSASLPGRSAGAIDPCLVGHWSTTSASQQIPVGGIGTIKFRLTTPYSETVTINPDGSATDGYHDTKMEGVLNGHTYTLNINGVGHFTLRTANGTITFFNTTATGTITVSVDQTEATSVPLPLNTDPMRYTCKGDTLTEQEDALNFDATLTRQ